MQCLSKAFKWIADLRAVEIFRASVVPGYAGAPRQFRNGIDGKHRLICREALTPDLGFSVHSLSASSRRLCCCSGRLASGRLRAPRLKKMGNASPFRVGWCCVESFFFDWM